MSLFDKIVALIGREKSEDVHYSIEKGMKRTKGLWIYSITAPFVVPFALMFCKWESENLPKWARKWDNNVNLNGDSGDYVEVDGVVKVIQPMEDTPEVRKRCYWTWFGMNLHPRSFLARWIWIGFRNRGKQAYVDAGVHISHHSELLEYGTLGKRGEYDGEILRCRDGYWHYHSTKRFLHFFCLTEQRGWKVQNIDSASEVAIPVSYRAIKLWK